MGRHVVRILLVNWQDRENPQAGGAEIHLHEIFGRLAARGHEVTLLCGGWPGCAAARARSTASTSPRRHAPHLSIPRASLLRRSIWRGAGFDVLVEDINKVPLYTPRWGGPPVVALVPHLFGGDGVPGARRAARRRGLARRAAARPRLSRRAVRGDQREHGRRSRRARHSARARRGDLSRHRHASATRPTRRAARADAGLRLPRPAQEVQGRAPRHPRVRGDAASRRRRSRSPARATTGPTLEALAASLDLGERVRFLGRITEAEKLALLRRAWALVFASPKEGWGITNLEAAACAHARRRIELAGHSRVGARRRDGLSRPARRRRRDGRRDAPHRRRRASSSTRLGAQARAFAETLHLGARRRTRPQRICIACIAGRRTAR